MSKDSKLDVLAVGDVVTDAFIDLMEKYEYVEDTPDGKVINIPWGTKIPYEQAIIVEGVGNAANAAVAFARLGQEENKAEVTRRMVELGYPSSLIEKDVNLTRKSL